MASRVATFSMTALALLLGFLVMEILRNVTEIAVLLTSVVLLVVMGGLLRRPSRWGGCLSLWISLAVLLLFIGLGWKRVLHPFWAVFPVTLFVVSVATWVERRQSG
jgi:hypothetical protein